MGPGISVRFGHCPNTPLQDQSHSISSFMHRLLSRFINSSYGNFSQDGAATQIIMCAFSSTAPLRSHKSRDIKGALRQT